MLEVRKNFKICQMYNWINVRCAASASVGPGFDIRRGQKLTARMGGDIQLLIARLNIKDLD